MKGAEQMLTKYITEYVKDLTFYPAEHISQEICGIKAEIDVMEYSDPLRYLEKAHIVLEKGDFKYACECVDAHDWDNLFFCVTQNQRTYLCFRKTLYGFTLLDTNTLLEEYDYFPDRVLDGHESFIMTEARSFGDMIIFDGCYWACPYICFAYDHAKKRFLNLSEAYGSKSQTHFVIKKDKLVLIGSSDRERGKEVAVTQEELCRLFNEKGVLDF